MGDKLLLVSVAQVDEMDGVDWVDGVDGVDKVDEVEKVDKKCRERLDIRYMFAYNADAWKKRIEKNGLEPLKS